MFVRFGAAVFCLLLAGPADAACKVATTGIDFGSYDVFVTVPLDSAGTVTVSCDRNPPTDVTVEIGPSASSGGFQPRTMRSASASDRLNYNLFTNASRNVVWGDGNAGTARVVLVKVNKNRPQTATIYGRIPPGQNVSVGSYSDRITVTITP
ncbi:MAG: spore coat protein U domain-containing protein [Deltaproteobacteria bacterium]|nr:spore coat protein U domain-containing protein [Deltaproteobacteria bacterium]